MVPLTAVVEGETIIGPDLSDEEWKDLAVRHRKGLPVTMGCCGAPGHLRVSKTGTRHFYHAVDAGCHFAEESKEHLEIKYQVYRICQSEGWETRVEFPAPDRTWISDVYAVKDGRKIVFEIQISTISPAVLEERDVKYRAEGIESYWLLDHFLGRAKDFASGYEAHLFEKAGRPGETFPILTIHSLQPVLKTISSSPGISGVPVWMQRNRHSLPHIILKSPSRYGLRKS